MGENLIDGEKAARMRAALSDTIALLPSTAELPRRALATLYDQPSVILAILHDEISKGAK